MISIVASAMALYSALVLERDTIFCFEMRLGPKNTAKPLIDFRSYVHPAQSMLENVLTIVEVECWI
jgi:hypothetical protein